MHNGAVFLEGASANAVDRRWSLNMEIKERLTEGSATIKRKTPNRFQAVINDGKFQTNWMHDRFLLQSGTRGAVRHKNSLAEKMVIDIKFVHTRGRPWWWKKSFRRVQGRDFYVFLSRFKEHVREHDERQQRRAKACHKIWGRNKNQWTWSSKMFWPELSRDLSMTTSVLMGG